MMVSIVSLGFLGIVCGGIGILEQSTNLFAVGVIMVVASLVMLLALLKH